MPTKKVRRSKKRTNRNDKRKIVKKTKVNKKRLSSRSRSKRINLKGGTKYNVGDEVLYLTKATIDSNIL